MKAIKKFFCEFDFYAAPATLRIKEEPDMKTGVVGFISFALGIFFTYVFISSFINVWNFQKIQYSSSSTVIRSNLTYAQFPMFGVNLDWMDLSEFQALFEISVYNHVNGRVQLINMRPCVAEDWILLGDDYQEQFDNNYLQLFYCPNKTGNFTLKRTFSQPTFDFMSIVLSPCRTAVPSCNKSNIIPYMHDTTTNLGAMQLSVYFLDIGIHPDENNPVQYSVNSDTKIQMSSAFGGGAKVEFSTYKIDTDVNIWPWEIIQTLNGSIVDTVRSYQIGFHDATVDTIGLIYLTTNQKKYLINRKVGKVDQLLSYAGGLFSLIIAFFGFFLQSYNQYKYELTVAEGAFKTDKQNKVATSDDLNIWAYFKYTIFDWVNVIFCRQIPFKDCKEINETRDEVINHLEADRLLRRLNKIQNGLKLCLSHEEDVCVNLVCPPKLDNAKNNRLILDYYNQITNGRCPLTLEDINTQEKLNAYFSLPENSASNMGSRIQPEIQTTFTRMGQNNKDVKSFFQGPSLVWEDDDKLNVISNIMQIYPEIKKEAEQIVLDEEYEKIQMEIAQSFSNLRYEVKAQLQERIPIHVLYRILKRINSQKELKAIAKSSG